VEKISANDTGIQTLRKQLERLNKVDLSNAIRQLGNLRATLSSFDSVSGSVKQMINDMTKLGLTARNTTALKKGLSDVGKQARQTKEEIAEVIEASMKAMGSSSTQPSSPRTYTRPAGAWEKDQARSKEISKYIDDYAASLDSAGAKGQKAGKKIKESMDDANKATSGAKKSTNQLAAAFVRIVRFKVVAVTMQKVTQSVKDGIESLRAFDKEFDSAVTSYSASGKVIGNSVAAMIQPFLESFEPLAVAIGDGVASLTNAISHFQAILTNADTYEAVRPVSEIKKELEDSKKEAKELRTLIAGFDELNIFQSQKEDKEIKATETKFTGDRGELLKETEGLLKMLAAAGGVAGITKLLTDLFTKKNKTLEEQTAKTAKDTSALEILSKVASSLALPAISLLGAALSGLLGYQLPQLDAGNVTVPAAEAQGAAEGLGEKVGKVFGEIPALVGDAVGAGKKTYDEYIEGLELSFSAFENRLLAADGPLVSVENGFKDTANSLVAAFDNAFSAIDISATNLLNSITEKLKGFWQLLGGFGNLGAGETNPGVSSIGAALPGFKDQKSLEKAVEEAKSIVGIGSEATPNGVSGAAVDLIAAGIKGTVGKKVEDPASDALGKVVGAIVGITLGKALISSGGGGGAIGALISGGGGAGGAFVTGDGNLFNPPDKMVSLFAGGGIVKSGEVFIARENGLPEMVGSFGTRSGVANNEQITVGIASAVEAVLSSYIPSVIEAIEENQTVVSIGDDQIAQSVQRANRKFKSRTGRSMFA
jgi:hypothetical protein